MSARISRLFAFVGALACAPLTIAEARPTAPHLAPIAAQPGSFGDVRLRALVRDRSNLPVPGVRLRFRVRLDGQAKQKSGDALPAVDSFVVDAVTDSAGAASATIQAPATAASNAWFRGTVTADVSPAPDAETAALSTVPLRIVQTIPATAPSSLYATDTPTLTVFDAPTRMVDGFPFWAAKDGSTKKIVVLVEGFDLDNVLNASDAMRLVAPAGDPLRQHGIGFIVVNFANSHKALETHAERVTEAIQTAAKLSGGKVAVAGLSMGGLISRYSLCAAEKTGTPLPVHTLLLLDTPNRGATINAGLQAITLRYGTPADRKKLTSEAARELLQFMPADVKWKPVGLLPPLLGRLVPSEWKNDTHYHDAFMAHLKAQGGKNGYPTQCRVVSVANSSRNGAPEFLRGDLLTLWLPFARWTLPAQPADHAPGSLIPPLYVQRYTQIYPFGLAGSYLRSAPTFVSAESALDARADETPPFAAWYARPDNLPPLAHDDVDLGAAAFTVRELLAAPWQ